MYAVYRETHYQPEMEIQEAHAFKEFQNKHTEQPGYIGTVATKIDNGHYPTISFWKSKENMDNGRKAIGQAVEELITPLMTSPAVLLCTGPVILRINICGKNRRLRQTRYRWLQC
jgi:hypothetical protein